AVSQDSFEGLQNVQAMSEGAGEKKPKGSADEVEIQVLRENLSRGQGASGQRPAVDSEAPVDLIQSTVTADTWADGSASANSRFINNAHRPSQGQVGQGQAEGVAGPIPPPTSLATLNPGDRARAAGPANEFGLEKGVQDSVALRGQVPGQ